MWKWLSRIVTTLALLVLALKLADWAARRGDSLPAAPNPNGYEAMVAVAREVRAPQGDLAELGPAGIRQAAQTNRESLARLHDALQGEIGVPLKIERGWADQHAEDVKKLKKLAVLLGLQSRAELLEGNTNMSAQCLLDIILLGQSLARGGLFSDGANALVLEAIGWASLRAQAPFLEADLCRSAAQVLERGEARREDPRRILKTEKDWSAANFGLVGRAGGLLLRKSLTQRNEEFIKRYEETTRRTRRLMLLLAARAVELETGQKVSSPAALVPSVLKAVPLDPAREAPMTEIPTEI